MSLDEARAEEVALTWLAELGDPVVHGPQITPGDAILPRLFSGKLSVGRTMKAVEAVA